MKAYSPVLLFLSVVSFCASAFALTPVQFDDADEQLLDARGIEYLADPAEDIAIDDIAKLSRLNTLAWLPGQREVLNFGLSDSVYWIRFSLQAGGDSPRRLFVELDNSALDDVRFYYPGVDGDYHEIEAGEVVPYRDRVVAHRNFVFPVELKPQSPAIFYLRIKSVNPLFLPLVIRSDSAWHHYSRRESVGLGVYFSMITLFALAIMLYFLVTRSRLYLYYFGYMASMELLLLANSGVGAGLLYPGYPLLANRLLPVTVLLASICAALITRNLLASVRLLPGMSRALKYVVYAALLLLPVSLLGQHMLFQYVVMTLAGLVLLLVLLAAIGALRERTISVYLYLGAVVALLAGLAIRQLLEGGWLEYGALTKWSLQAGVGLQFAFFAAAMALVLHSLRMEKAQAQEEVIERLRNLDRLKDEFLANISHELRTPLNGIIGLGKSLLSGINGSLAPEQLKSQQLIVQSAQRLARLVDDILDYSRLRNGSFRLALQAVNLNHVVESVIGVVRPLASQKNIRIRNGVVGQTIWVRADESRLHQIMYNLFGNAIKFTEAGTVEVSAVVHNDEVVVSVTDSGTGIEAEELPHIFDAFHQGDGSMVRAHAGAGLGLSITRMLIELLNGRIEVKSRRGEGTTVTFVLPVASAEEIYERNSAATQGVEPLLPVFPGMDSATVSVHELRKHIEHSINTPHALDTDEPGTILAIDDDPINLKVLEAILTDSGFRLVTATSGEDVASLVEEEEPDLLLLDLMMPGMSGYEVCTELRKRYNAVELPVIMVTARTQTADLVSAYDCGANDYITKPFDSEELLARIYSHLHIKKLVNTLKENEQLREEIRLRHMAEHNLRVSQARLTELLDLDESAILCFDRDNEAVYFNTGASGLFGYTDDELGELSASDLFAEDIAGLLRSHTAAHGVHHGRLRKLLNCTHRDGHLFQGDAMINTLDVNGGGGFAIVLNPVRQEVMAQGGEDLAEGQELLHKRESQLAAVEQSINSILEMARTSPELMARISGFGGLPEGYQQGDKTLLREQVVVVMRSALACWEHESGRSKIDLAEDCMIWPVYIDKSTPTTRTLDKYLNLKTVPKNPRVQRVIDTAEFVLRKCSDTSTHYRSLQEALNDLRLVMSGKSPGSGARP